MNLSRAITEPLVGLIAFHNQFNRNIKFSFGAIAQLQAQARDRPEGPISLPTGGEPWAAMSWNDIDVMATSAETFIAEMGIVRAASAFEDYMTGALAEFDRAMGNPETVEADTSVSRFIKRLGCNRAGLERQLVMWDFFDEARNCIVHRSGRANAELARLASSEKLRQTVASWPKRTGKWKVALPDVLLGEVVRWQPRHAIMASDAYYRLATALDRHLIAALDERGVVRMAAHWCLFAENTVQGRGKLNVQVRLRALLADRYCVIADSQEEVIAALRDVGIWENVRKEFDKRFPEARGAGRKRA
ncbi:hypothetical protein [Brucella pituitosa]|uniref:hypothetical protein n=1 Tax=Brucella pituitosa TaxID=571256 RepID=UPI003F4A8C4A